MVDLTKDIQSINKIISMSLEMAINKPGMPLSVLAEPVELATLGNSSKFRFTTSTYIEVPDVKLLRETQKLFHLQDLVAENLKEITDKVSKILKDNKNLRGELLFHTQLIEETTLLKLIVESEFVPSAPAVKSSSKVN